MASRRGGSLLTFDYFFYVFGYLSVITVPLMITQILIHQFQFRKVVNSHWLALVFIGYAITHAALGFLSAWAFDF